MTPVRQENDDIPEFTIHDRCRKARERTGLSQTAFAQRIEVSKATISNYESGAVKALRAVVLRPWALASGVDYEWLRTGWAARDSNPEPAAIRFSAAA